MFGRFSFLSSSVPHARHPWSASSRDCCILSGINSVQLLFDEMDGSGARASQAFRERTRSTNPCDGCALRRVRCDGGRPCKECQKRLLTCTTLRITRKRGPKGPRQSTSQKVRHLQRQLQLANSAEVSVRRRDGATSQPTSPGASSSFASPHFQRSSLLISGPSPKYRPLPLETYCKFLGIFQERLYSVWPVLDCSGLITRLVNDEHDHEAWTLAASVCAGVIAQLRLPEHRQVTTPSLSASTFSKVCQTQAAISVQTTCQHFNADTTHFRALCDYRERPSIFSLLSSFFLHIYCANSDLLSTAGFHLRDSLTQAHMLGLHRPNTYAGLSADERELRLRVYWVLFVSERTYCIQHSLPTILRPINQHPSPNKGPDGYTDNAMVSFLYLTKLFTFLDEDLIESHSTSSIMAIGNGGAGDSVEKERARNKVTLFQSDLGSATKGVGLDETQKVDIFITRNWIRILLWQYTIRHFTMSYTTDDQAFSLLLPALVAHEMLGLFSAVSPKSICAHGYGMVRYTPLNRKFTFFRWLIVTF